MDAELEKILSTPKNEDFVKLCFKRIQHLDLTSAQLFALTDVEIANAVIKERNRYTYPIIVEVPIHGEVTQEMTHSNGNRRYYDERFLYQGRAYILCNDWYFPTLGKKNIKDTRTPFVNWIALLNPP